ncbi:hypothetical protein AGMMS49992_01370 [Clostridia bacterium]|nr:hypothetical protein AGMMS49992_01370 [Clostridia bacterium]
MLYVDIAREEDFAKIPDNPADDYTVKLWDDITIRGSWTPLKGHNITFCGQYHTLRGLTGPLFAQSMDAIGVDPLLPADMDAIASDDITITNLRIYVDITNTDRNIMGGLVRLGRRFKATDCAVYVNIIAQASLTSDARCIGGVAGMLDDASELNHCAVYGSLQCQSEGGGLVGYAKDSHLCGCVNHATVTTVAGETGGIVGLVEGTFIEGCENAADGTVVSGGDFAGGIAGQILTDCRLEQCTNFATIRGAASIGGILGTAYLPGSGFRVMGNTNVGAVSGDHWIGGIVGTLGYGYIQVSNNLSCANVTADGDAAGGVLGVISDNGGGFPPTTAIGTAFVKNNMVSSTLIKAATNARRIAGIRDPAVCDLQLYNNQSYIDTHLDDDVYDDWRVKKDDAELGPAKLQGTSTFTCAKMNEQSYKPFLAPPPPKPWPKKVVVNGKCIPAPPPIPEWFKTIQCCHGQY